MARRLRRAAGTGAALLGVLAATGCGAMGATARPHPGITAVTAGSDGVNARIGVLRLTDQGDARSCTASVVDSPNRDLLVTAAHCVYQSGEGPMGDLAFAPGYRDGSAPLGDWHVSKVTVDQHWQDDADPEYDVAFLTVDPLGGQQIEDAVGGGTPLGVNRGFDLSVTVTGYPYDHEEPITCTTRTTAQSATQERFDCAGFSDGTSGSPWLSADGQLVGVIGGYQQGGDTPDTSYSVSFDGRVSSLFQQAVGG
ncbi:trypsin-like serine peptidase [Kitasatospora viridis]|uniref:V8-like Glu-specific endopeptidase n=1 Tax=Kitasatospora viridis TaxID=281105 RepID=A0A561ULE3_9ACTN|nr:trypsin-like peptidase domain-containing protein [Kitasatospora viridis]TWG00186.1 V8-like Glu-specific endopeptidase [Kitasatospora viridis]